MRKVLFFSFFWICAFAQEKQGLDTTERLLKDLQRVDLIQSGQKILPVRYNLFGTIGYGNIPSARMAMPGTFAFVVGNKSFPENMYTATIQLFDRLEIKSSYLFLPEQNRTAPSSGTEKKAYQFSGMKYAFLQKKDGFTLLPEFALGWDAFLGSCDFFSLYLVGTKQILDANLECSVGWSTGYLSGLFAGVQWNPLLLSSYGNLSFFFEYSAHQNTFSPNAVCTYRPLFGLSLELFDQLQVNVHTNGKKTSGLLAWHYNFGQTSGFFPKTEDPAIAFFQKQTTSLASAKKESLFVDALRLALQEQGLDLFFVAKKSKELWLRIVNVCYRKEPVVRKRVASVLWELLPDTVEQTHVILESQGLALQEYTFSPTVLQQYAENQNSEYTFMVLTPIQEVVEPPGKYEAQVLYSRKKPLLLYTLQPIVQPYFGGPAGKIQYDLGFSTGFDGYLLDSFYYALQASYIIKSTYSRPAKEDMIDLVDPSTNIFVRSDSILYNNSGSLHLEQAFLQKNWNLGKGCFAKAAAGYFETAYAGIATEFLFYPVDSCFAVGVEIAGLLKRGYNGVALERQVPRLENGRVIDVPYYGLQYFLHLYYQNPIYLFDFSCQIGQFLAKDRGVRFQAGKTFFSGVGLQFWITYTDGRDVVNGKRYFDKGLSFSFPLDLFLNKSSRKKIEYSLPFRLRDVGAIAKTGVSLYDTIYNDRLNLSY